jgi:hypothetical protein
VDISCHYIVNDNITCTLRCLRSLSISVIEDISGRGEKYNFLLGVSHPYTTVDVQAKAELGKSDDKLTAGIDIKYMNARRQTKNFALMTEIDRLRRHLNVQVIVLRASEEYLNSVRPSYITFPLLNFI